MASSQRLMLPSLPFELIEEILYRTPAESLIRFKSTCKKWYALITNKKFIYNHLDHSPEKFIRIENDRTVWNRLNVIDPVTGIVSVSPIPDALDRNCEIYEFNSGSWRSIDANFDGEVDSECEGVSVNGDMYWIAVKKKEGFILNFDFSMETFNHICFCPRNWNKRLGCFNGDRLSLFQQDEKSGEIHVSVTNKLSDMVVSFSRYFNVTPPDLPELQSQDTMASPGYSNGKHRNNIAWCEETDLAENTYITLYKIDQGGIGKKTETGRYEASPFYCLYLYIPSLIPVPE